VISQATARGGADYHNPSASTTLQLAFGPPGTLSVSFYRRLRVIEPTGSGVAVRLPDAGSFPFTGPFAQVVINKSGTQTFVIQDRDGNTLQSVSPSKVVFCHLLDRSTDDGQWVFGVVDLIGQGS